MGDDNILRGGFIGVISKIAMDVFQTPIWRLKIIKHPLAHYAASLILDVDTIHHTLFGTVVSIICDYIYGIFWGIIFVYFVQFTGKRHLIFKGCLFGTFLWFFSFGGLRSLPIVKLQEVIAGQVLYILLFHLVFGLALGICIKRFDKSSI